MLPSRLHFKAVNFALMKFFDFFFKCRSERSHECSGLLAWTRSGSFSTADWTKSGEDPKCCILIGCYLATLCPVSNPENGVVNVDISLH